MTYKEYCENELGYTPLTTIYDDYIIAEKFGLKAIKDTYMRLFKEYKDTNNYKCMTELCITTNHLIWFNYKHGECNYIEEERAKLYNALWEDCDQWCCDNLKGEALDYFMRTTD